jgi:hypothetical protein
MMFYVLDKWEREKVSQLMQNVEKEIDELFSGFGSQTWMGDNGRDSARRFLLIKKIIESADWDNTRKAEIISVIFGEAAEV